MYHKFIIENLIFVWCIKISNYEMCSKIWDGYLGSYGSPKDITEGNVKYEIDTLGHMDLSKISKNEMWNMRWVPWVIWISQKYQRMKCEISDVYLGSYGSLRPRPLFWTMPFRYSNISGVSSGRCLHVGVASKPMWIPYKKTFILILQEFNSI